MASKESPLPEKKKKTHFVHSDGLLTQLKSITFSPLLHPPLQLLYCFVISSTKAKNPVWVWPKKADDWDQTSACCICVKEAGICKLDGIELDLSSLHAHDQPQLHMRAWGNDDSLLQYVFFPCAQLPVVSYSLLLEEKQCIIFHRKLRFHEAITIQLYSWSNPPLLEQQVSVYQLHKEQNTVDTVCLVHNAYYRCIFHQFYCWPN